MPNRKKLKKLGMFSPKKGRLGIIDVTKYVKSYPVKGLSFQVPDE